MAKTMILIGFVASLLFVSLIAYSFPVFAQGPDSAPGKPDVISVSGIIPGKGLIVHIWVVVPPGADRNEAASAALANQGARPFTADEFSTIALFWDQFSDSDPENDSVIQNYNPKNDPTNGGGKTALLNTHDSWNGVTTSIFEFEYGGETGRCPSLVQECRGPQKFDGNNDVAWLALRDANTLGVTWSGTTTDEADIALNTNFPWATDGENNFDVETVFLHENGHVVGLGHSEYTNAIMYPSYQGPSRVLQEDDIDGITFLYQVVNSVPSVTITSPVDGSTFDSGATILFEGSAIDTEDGDLTATLAWSSDLDGSIGIVGGSVSTTLSDGVHTITASVTDVNGATGTGSVSITVGPVNSAPSVTITSPVDGSTFDSGATILFEGSAIDTEDGDLTATLAWSSDLDGSIGIVGGSVSTTLSDGTHTITAEVTDSGELSESASVSITVGDSPTAVSVDSITYATEGGKNNDKHLFITISLLDDVSGASVSIDLFRNDGSVGSATGTTDSNGNVTFTLKNARSGCYTTDITSISSNSSWDGVTPANEFCK